VLRRGVSFQEAEQYLRAKRDTPTTLTSREYLTLWNDETRRKAFFSARVASADLLTTLHETVQDVVDGKASEEQAVEWLRDFAKNQGRETLARAGWAPAEEAKGLTELASRRRLQLIVYQNTKIAHETGAYQQWAATRDIHPYGRWRLGYAEKHRESHVRLDGNIYSFDHPIWRQAPPGSEFGCHCWRELLTAEEAQAAGVPIQPSSSPVPEAQVRFDPGAGMDRPPPIRQGMPLALEQTLRSELPQARFGTRLGESSATGAENAVATALPALASLLTEWIAKRRARAAEREDTE
jgi:hypothetical protein